MPRFVGGCEVVVGMVALFLWLAGIVGFDCDGCVGLCLCAIVNGWLFVYFGCWGVVGVCWLRCIVGFAG